MAFVIDASAMLGVILEEQPAIRIAPLIDRFEAEDASVPAIFPFEVFNSLETARRRGRIDAARIVQFTDYLSALDLDIRPAPGIHEAAALRRVAQQHGLTVYGASYLALALSADMDLITSDMALLRAALAAGVMATQP